MPKIVLSRIDERLVHGQVGVQWVGFADANIVVVVNDEVAQDTIQQNLMEMVLADGISIRFWSVQKTIETIHKASDRQRILLVCRAPKDFRQLIEGGVSITHINVGNMHYAEGKKQVSKTISVDAEDVEEFNKLKALGVTCTVQGVPTESGIDLFTLI